jgi:tripartite-type tricarboxylate transporter receptor subunit TctC
LSEKSRLGTIKAYAVTSRTRTPAAPDVLTVDEAGLPALQITSWHGLWVPKGSYAGNWVMTE